MKNKSLVYSIVAVTFAVLFFGGAKVYKNRQQKLLDFMATERAELFVRPYSPRLGSDMAKVILTEFLDPECESCRMFYPVVKSLMSEFEGKIQWVVRYAPFHQNSKTAIKALEAARMQGKYWEALEVLFERQPEWGSHHNPRPELIFGYLQDLGLDMAQLQSDLESPTIANIIAQDEKDLETLGVRGTPTFYVNGKPLQEFSVNGLISLIQSEIE